VNNILWELFLAGTLRTLKSVCYWSWLLTILGDPGADSGDEGKSKRAEKYIWNEEK